VENFSYTTELSIDIDLDEEGREQMYQKLCKMFGEEEVEETLEDQLIQHLTQMFDNRDQLKRMEREME
jgi:hypothetical protein